MQSRILQVTQLGNFSPGFPGISSMSTIRKAERRGLLRVVPVNCTIARLRGDPGQMMIALWLPIAWGIHYPIPPWRSCRQPPNVGK